MVIFLRRNGFARTKDISINELTDFALDIESDKLEFNEIVNWIGDHFGKI